MDQLCVDSGRKPTIHIVVFSKNRPFQLRECLKSLELKARGAAHTQDTGTAAKETKCDLLDLRVTVICNVEEQYAESYRSIEGSLHRDVSFRYETPSIPFYQHLVDIVINDSSAGGLNSDFTCFVVDDALFIRPPNFGEAVRVLQSDETALGYHFRLNPGICFNHPTQACQPPPSMWGTFRGSDEWPQSVFWEYADGAGDWSCAWDVSATMYRTDDVRQVLRKQVDSPDWHHPNTLEVGLNKMVALRDLGRNRGYCPIETCAVIITVNRVQHIYENPVYEQVESDSEAGLSTLSQIPLVMSAGVEFDIAWYQRRCWKCAHIGAWQLTESNHAIDVAKSPFKDKGVSIVLPVHNAAEFVEAAIQSVALQEGVDVWELICIDDGSTDGSLERIRHAISKCNIADRSHVIPLPERRGISNALSLGFRMATLDYIARMDADDICHPQRLMHQLAALEDDETLAGVGCAVWGVDQHSIDEVVCRPCIVNPCDASLVRYSTLFFNPLAHPSVIFRRDALLRVLSDTESMVYNEWYEPAEDYELWLRCMWKHGLRFSNVGHVGLKLRRHTSNVSKNTLHREEKRCAAMFAHLPVPRMEPGLLSHIIDHAAAVKEDLVDIDKIVSKVVEYFLVCCNVSLDTLSTTLDPIEWTTSAVRDFIVVDIAARACVFFVKLLTSGTHHAGSQLKELLRRMPEPRSAFSRARIKRVLQHPAIRMLLHADATKRPNPLNEVAAFLR